jgi:hypothetical protein
MSVRNVEISVSSLKDNGFVWFAGLKNMKAKKEVIKLAKIYRGTNIGTGGQAVIVIDGEKKYSLPHIVRHSPDGFQWGYGGSGPSELARCILLDLLGNFPKSIVDHIYQDFKRYFIEGAADDLLIKEEDIRAWLKTKKISSQRIDKGD